MWKNRKKKHFPRKIIFPVIIFFLVGFIFAFYKSNFLTIKKVDIGAENISCTDSNKIKVFSGLLGQNFFLIKSKKTEDDLKNKFVCIKSVVTSKIFPDKVDLKISTREAVAVLAILKDEEASLSATPSAQEIKDYFLVDNEGVVFGKGEGGLNILKIYLFNREISVGGKLTGEIANVFKILEKVRTYGIQVNTARIDQGIFIITGSPPVSEIFFRLNSDIDTQLASLQLILNKAKMDLNELEFIDLRFDKPVVRFAPKK